MHHHYLHLLIVPVATGLFALAGTALGQFLGIWGSHIQRGHDSNLRKRQRLDKMTDLVTESLVWQERILAIRNTQDFRLALPPIQVYQLVLLARMSFPDLVVPARNYHQSCIDFHQLVWECRTGDIDASFGAYLATAIQLRPEMKKRNEQIRDIRRQLEDAFVAEASKIGVQ